MVALHELPPAIRAAVPPDRFLYALRTGGGWVVREVVGGRSHELEFDEALGRFLTVDERRSRMPADRSFEVVGDGHFSVTQTHHIDADTEELRARLAITDDGGRPVTELTKAVFDPTPWRGEEVAALAIRHHDLPRRYASWPRDDQVRYWAAQLHRFRRVHGESGRDEDELYTPALVRDMEKVDPRVRELLADILALVGRLEQTDPAQAIEAFERRSGISVARP
ncbi:MAG TPA: hypothetical protein VL172_16840 [Kofleriaceae bacterium]|nr:hypothetical protein [Kofleriaceae bacterium]